MAPEMAMMEKTVSFWNTGASPASSSTTREASRIPWPAISSGPARAPLAALSLIVTVSRGPGIIAPDRAMTSEEKNIKIIWGILSEVQTVSLEKHLSKECSWLYFCIFDQFSILQVVMLHTRCADIDLHSKI